MGFGGIIVEAVTGTNAEAEEPVGRHKIGDADFYDAELRRYNEHFRAATRVRPDDRVLDVGCGTGQTTREAARAAIYGSALGLDLSARMLEQARRLSEADGLSNVTYLQADAQVHPFPTSHFDLSISRFGTMFFADPVAAFTNIGRALRPGARLVLLVWQHHAREEWFTAVRQALSGVRATVPASASALQPFSLADPAITRGILAAAGFTEVIFTDVQEPIYYGLDSATAYDAVVRLQHAKELLANLDPALAVQARQRLRATLAAHETDDGVLFDSRAWIITARRH
jgi:ubiquinone/menaquinone biosynthesis C-methylase UbiE